MGSLLPGWEHESAKENRENPPEWLTELRRSGSGVRPYTRKHPPTKDGDPASPRMSAAAKQHSFRLKRSSLPVDLAGSTSGHDDSLLSDRIQWWKMIESSAFNNPGMDLPEDYRKGSYTPQHAAATAHKQQQQQQQEAPQAKGDGAQGPQATTDATERSISTPVDAVR